jgi:CheY-like chemotaxis protein
LPTILVADDNSNIQKMVSLAVKDLGVDVVSVGNGEAAVRKLNEMVPDLILLDIFMPVRSGYEVCEFVKHNPRLAGIPVVLLTGAFDPFDEKEAERVGADGVLKKPFVPPDPLLAMVKHLLDHAPVPVGVAAGPAQAPTRTELSPALSASPVSKIIEMPPPAEVQEEYPIPEEPSEEARPAYPAMVTDNGKPFPFTNPFASSLTADKPELAPETPVVKEEFRSWNYTPSVETFSPAVADNEEGARKYWESDTPPLPRRDESGLLRSAELEVENVLAPASVAEESPVVAQEPLKPTVLPAPEPTALVSSLNVVAGSDTPLASEGHTPEVSATSTASELARSSVVPEAQITAEAPVPPSPMNWPLAAEPRPEPPEPAIVNAHLPTEADPVQTWSVPPPPDPALIAAMVDSVIERMQPQIMDIVTRDILRPVIEALVRREFENRK